MKGTKGILAAVLLGALFLIGTGPAFAEEGGGPGKLPAPELTAVKSETVKQAVLRWEPAEDADGYQISYRLRKDAKKSETAGPDAEDASADKETGAERTPVGDTASADPAKAGQTDHKKTAETAAGSAGSKAAVSGSGSGTEGDWILVEVSGGAKIKAKLKYLLGGRKYQVRIRSYRYEESDRAAAEDSDRIAKERANQMQDKAGTRVFSDWSKTKTVKVKQDKWSDLKDKYAGKKKVRQLIFVQYKGDSKARLILYKKVKKTAGHRPSEPEGAAAGSVSTGSGEETDKTPAPAVDSDAEKAKAAGKSAEEASAAESDADKASAAGKSAAGSDPEAVTVTAWEKVLSCDAYTGQNGIGKEKEGDRKTPTGVYTLTHAFGVKKDPGSKMDYIKLNKYHYWCGDRDHYNQMIDIRDCPHSCRGEHLINYTRQYAYAMALNYNKKGTYGKGSAIFLHCYGYNPYTLGCVAVSEDNMKTILKTCGPKTKICIYRK